MLVEVRITDGKSMENLRSFNPKFKRIGTVAKYKMINRCPLWEKQIPSVKTQGVITRVDCGRITSRD